MRAILRAIDRTCVNVASWLVAKFFIRNLYYRYLVKSRFPTTDFMLAELLNTVCYKLKLDRVLMAPRYLFIEPTNTCNIACVMCPVPDNSMMTRARKMLTLDRLAMILDANPKVRVVYLTNWGEPLLHKQIIEIIRVCANRGLMIV